jgi:hypothetical protein
MSDELSAKQRAAVVKLLEAHGHKKPSFKNMTAVKALVAGGQNTSPRKAEVNVSISFDGPDRLVVGTKSYPIEPRRGKPTGDPLTDRCVRIQDSRTPLGVVMEVLGVSRERGSDMVDAAALYAKKQADAKRALDAQERQDAEFEDMFEFDTRSAQCLAQDT